MIIDTQIIYDFHLAFRFATLMIGAIIVIAVIFPWFLIVIICIVGLFFLFYILYIFGARDLKRL